MHNLETVTGFVWVLLGALGGASKVIVQLLNMKPLPTKLSIFWLLVANMFVSGFSGFLGAVAASGLTQDDNLHVIAAGIAGYMGVAALDLLSEAYKKRTAQ